VSATRRTVGDLVASLDDRFPFAWAEPWDRVGLAVGDPAAEVTRVFVTLDPTAGALEATVAAGANVMVTHHPAFLDPLVGVTPATAGVAFLAASLGVALIACHTNLDRAPDGAAALPLACGLRPGVPLESSRQPVSVVTVFVPRAAADAVLDAMRQAGAGRVGEYSGASFSTPGLGVFVPRDGTRPHMGVPGEPSTAEEARLEVVCSPRQTDAVVAAARTANPYEEPLIVVADAGIDRGAARLGRVSDLREPLTLRAFAEAVGAHLDVVPRVWGDPEAPVSRVASASGSGRSLVDAATAAGASVLLTGEVGYHVALGAAAAGLAIVEAGHDATEWPLVAVLAQALRSVEGLGDRVVAGEPAQRWWTP
jgi:dinuclear metal center YbgI/SA1388 family protein